MKALVASFALFWRQIAKDNMLIMLCVAPLLIGFIFKFGIPFAEIRLTEYFDLSAILSPYYLMFDLFLVSIAPILFCFASAMVILGEIDDNISNYLAVTPIGKSGYLISRLVFPAFISFIFSSILMFIFSLSDVGVFVNLIVSLLSGGIGVMVAMMIITLSSNKVEGMAIGKLTGFIMLGVPVPFFILGTTQYLACFLPSFWIAKFAITANFLYAIGALGCLTLWGTVLYKRFVRKVV